MGYRIFVFLTFLFSITAKSETCSNLKMGIMGSFFRDTPAHLIEPMTRPFQSLFKTQTGLAGELVVTDTTDALSEKILNGEVAFGVFNGFEFAWAKKKNPDLRALVIATAPSPLQAIVVKNKDSNAEILADLAKIVLPRLSKGYVALYLDREAGSKKETTEKSAEDVLDDVTADKNGAAIVDASILKTYETQKPGWFKYLKEVVRSKPFPNSVVVYKDGADPSLLKIVKDGLLKANQTRVGKSVLNMCKIEAFLNLPADYDKQLDDSLKLYPEK